MKIILSLLLTLPLFHFAYCQSKLDTPFLAYRPGAILNLETKNWDTFSLCGQYIIADKNGYFTMTTGCERNIGILLGRYTFKNDTFKISPFNFINEPEFLSITKTRSTSALQKVQFFSADLKPIKGVDSSWVIRLIKRRKSLVVDKTGEKIISLKRKKYDGMELLQMSKIFGMPIILFLDHRYDYKVAINLPKEAVERYIIGGDSIGGIGIIKGNSFILNNQKDYFTIKN